MVSKKRKEGEQRRIEEDEALKNEKKKGEKWEKERGVFKRKGGERGRERGRENERFQKRGFGK